MRSLDWFLSLSGPVTIWSWRRPNPNGGEHRMPVPRSAAGLLTLCVSLTMPAVGSSQEEPIQVFAPDTVPKDPVALRMEPTG